MSNELLLLIGAFLMYSSIVFINRFFGKSGLFAWVAVAVVLANIVVVKQVTVFGLSITLGNVMFASVFLCTDILNEYYGPKVGRQAVYVGLLAAFLFIVVSQFAIAFTPNELDFIQGSMTEMFTFTTRITFASLTMFFLANMADVYLYDKLRKKLPLWARNNVATMVCNCGENFLFTFAAFYGLMSVQDLVFVSISTCIIEIMLAILDTPFLYIAKRCQGVHVPNGEQ